MPDPHTKTIEEDRARPSVRQSDRAPRRSTRPHAPEATSSDRPNRAITARRLSVASAALILVGGYVHYCLYMHGYLFIPKIGVSFLLQASASVVLAAALLVQHGRRRHPYRHSVAVAQLTRLCAIGLSVGTLAALGIAHTKAGLFQFREIGLEPAPQTILAIVTESMATLLLSIAVLEAWVATRNQTPVAAVAPSARRPMREAA